MVISNLYPPHHLGGYEMGCKEVVEGLKARGHEARVLTSTYGIDQPATDDEVYRWLVTDFGCEPKPPARRALQLLRKEARNQGAFKRVAKDFCPDLVYVWNLTGISVSLALWAQQLGIPTSFYVFDRWLKSWRNDGWYALWPPSPRRRIVRLVDRAARSSLNTLGLLTTGALDLSHVQFASHYLKRDLLEAGEHVAAGEVIHWGINLGDMPFKIGGGEPTRLLFVGQIGPHKGVHTAVEALRILVHDHGRSELKMTVVGGSTLPNYVSEIKQLARSYRLEENIEFTGAVTHERLPEIYRAHDILLFPSVCDEGLGITILEAMAFGLGVIGTASGGSAEVLEHEVTGLVFPKEDAEVCARHVLRLLNDRELFERLRLTSRQRVEESFNTDTMMEKIERSLKLRLGNALIDASS